MEITIPTPPGFNFRRTVLSHGWCALLPFEFDKTDWTLVRVVDAGETGPVTVKISTEKGYLAISTSGRLKKRAGEKIVRDVRHMFRLDDDLREFYRATSTEPDFAWIAREGAGRLLRSPTVFEDRKSFSATRFAPAIARPISESWRSASRPADSMSKAGSPRICRRKI